ncbi:hypothetical protein CGZ80_14105 [Rhodopirellula sp. MGV]|nr:hypothetical protein CGZ80_14105 [Rhodopirellula sp. MGV]PNY34289.1 hypothetical protein C2E31_23950 [Rhodopirellula baltica]
MSCEDSRQGADESLTGFSSSDPSETDLECSEDTVVFLPNSFRPHRGRTNTLGSGKSSTCAASILVCYFYSVQSVFAQFIVAALINEANGTLGGCGVADFTAASSAHCLLSGSVFGR